MEARDGVLRVDEERTGSGEDRDWPAPPEERAGGVGEGAVPAAALHRERQAEREEAARHLLTPRPPRGREREAPRAGR